MNPVFADTHYFLALLNRNEKEHTRSSQYRASGRHVVTTEFVLLELADALSKRTHRWAFARLLAELSDGQDVEIIPLSSELLHLGLEVFQRHTDKDWSLTDCTSFIVMKDRGLTEALTGDRHFDQAGFRALLA